MLSRIEMRLNKIVQTLPWGDQISLNRHSMIMSVARQITGLVFGSLARSILQRGVTLKLVPMAKRSSRLDGDSIFNLELYRRTRRIPGGGFARLDLLSVYSGSRM